MRWFISGLLALTVSWCLYVASPYWTLYRLAGAIESGNAAEIAERINLRALRIALARQLSGDLTAAAGLGGIASADAQVAAGISLVLAHPVLDGLVTPAGVARLLLSGPTGSPDGAPFGGEPVSLDDLDDFLAASAWRGFRNVYVSLPPGEPAATRYRLQLRFGRLRWRLVAVELPPAVRKRIADEIARQRPS